jgi:hypothetical protein
MSRDNYLKQCSSCHEYKRIIDFNIRRSSLDGHDSECIQCACEHKNKRFHEHKKLPATEYRTWRNNINEKNQQEKLRLKTEVFSHYCPDGIIKCANPFHLHNEDITDLDILTLDHINGDGYKDRNKYNKRGGITFYRRVKLENYPAKFQVLCCNCQGKKKVLFKEYGDKYKQERVGF